MDMNGNERKVTPEMIYVSRVKAKLVKQEDGSYKRVEIPKEPAATGYPEIDRMARLLARSDNATYEQICRTLGGDRVWRHALFKQVTGMRLQLFLQRYKTLIVGDYLCHTGLKIAEIVERIGISQSMMTRVFTKYYGCTPTTYRVRHRPTHYELIYET